MLFNEVLKLNLLRHVLYVYLISLEPSPDGVPLLAIFQIFEVIHLYFPNFLGNSLISKNFLSTFPLAKYFDLLLAFFNDVP